MGQTENRNVKFGALEIKVPDVQRHSLGSRKSGASKGNAHAGAIIKTGATNKVNDSTNKAKGISKNKAGQHKSAISVSALAKNQEIAMSRLSRSKWRRDPIKERLLFLTGVGSAQVEAPEYIRYLQNILAEKHFEREAAVIKDLAAQEVDREWLWKVKKEVDFTALEKGCLERERAARAALAAEDQDNQGALFTAQKEMNFFTIAQRTSGLDANRNVEKLVGSHLETMRKNAENGSGYHRFTRLLDLAERDVADFHAFIAADDIREIFVRAEAIIEDVDTVEDQEREEEEENEEKRMMVEGEAREEEKRSILEAVEEKEEEKEGNKEEEQEAVVEEVATAAERDREEMEEMEEVEEEKEKMNVTAVEEEEEEVKEGGEREEEKE